MLLTNIRRKIAMSSYFVYVCWQFENKHFSVDYTGGRKGRAAGAGALPARPQGLREESCSPCSGENIMLPLLRWEYHAPLEQNNLEKLYFFADNFQKVFWQLDVKWPANRSRLVVVSFWRSQATGRWETVESWKANLSGTPCRSGMKKCHFKRERCKKKICYSTQVLYPKRLS